MEKITSKVYVLMDDQSRIIRCEGGYTTSNIIDPENWVQIDEGMGDKYNLCQSHYFEGGLYTYDGIPRYKLADGQAAERTEEELAADRAEVPAPPPTQEDRLSALEAAMLALMEV